MPCLYKHKHGAQNYTNFSQETVEQALQKKRHGVLSLYTVSQISQLHTGLCKFTQKHGNKVSGWSVQEETTNLTRIVKCID